MKKAMIFLSFFLLVLISCKDDDCVNNDPTCSETVPTDEACLAHFERWFYNSETSSCEKKSYSGCEQYGFETESECLSCQCID